MMLLREQGSYMLSHLSDRSQGDRPESSVSVVQCGCDGQLPGGTSVLVCSANLPKINKVKKMLT